MIDAFFLFGPEDFYNEAEDVVFQELSNLTTMAPVERVLCHRQLTR